MPQSLGQMQPIFVKTVTELAADSKTCGQASQGTGTPVWELPPLNGWSGDPLDIPGTVKAFDRSDANNNYAQLLADGSNPGTTGDAIALKTQIDYVGCMERAFRARHATPVRCLAHNSARRVGHGHPAGVLMQVINYAQSVLAAGQSS